jgi:hypothetical protein
MTIAKDISIAVSERLLNIRLANGYNTECGTRVFRGRRRLDESVVPCIIIAEINSKFVDGTRTNVRVTTRYVIEGHSICDPNDPNDVGHDIVGDIKKAIFNGDLRFGGDVRSISFVSQNIAPREDGVSIVSASVEVDLVFSEDLSSP